MESLGTAPPVVITRGRRAASLAVAVAVTMLSVMPVVLVGAMAVFLRPDLDFSPARLGVVLSAFYAIAVLLSIPAGRTAQRLGPETAIVVAATGTAVSLLSVAFVARGWVTLLLCILAGGAANALAQPAASALITRDQPVNRQGTGFGILQTAIPLCTMLCGFVVPLINGSLTWRWAFAVAALGGLPVIGYAAARRGTDQTLWRPGATENASANCGLYRLAIVGALASAATMVTSSFYVESAVANGFSAEAAGLWLVIGSAFGISGRLLWGWVVDRWLRQPLALMSVLLVMGSAGMLLIAIASNSALLLTGTILAFGAGGGWKGLFFLSVVFRNPDRPSSAIGVTQSGLAVGSVLGPLGYGFLVEHFSYSVAWNVTAITVLMAPAVVAIDSRTARR